MNLGLGSTGSSIWELSWKLDWELAFLRILRGRLHLGELLVYEGHVGLLWSGFSLGLTPSVAG